MDFIYNDYANWRIENDELLNNLFKEETIISTRFKHVFEATDFLYNRRIEDGNLKKEEENIFSFGFNYLFEQVGEIELLLEGYYNDFDEMNIEGKTISLLLYIHDFQNELSEDKAKTEELKKFENKVLDYVKRHEVVPDTIYALFDDLLMRLFPKNDYYGVADIFYDIAEELGIIK